MAHHFTEADQKEKAIPLWLQAGQGALMRSANKEAVAHLQQGIELVRLLPATDEMQRGCVWPTAGSPGRSQ